MCELMGLSFVQPVSAAFSIREFGGRVEIVGDPKDHSTSAIIRTRLAPRTQG